MRRVGLGERDVLGDAVGEQEGVLEHDADGAAQLAERELPDVDAVDEDPTAVDVVEARQEPGDGGLPAGRRADHRDRFAGADPEVEPVEHRGAVPVGERHVVERKVAAPGLGERTGVLGVGHGGVGDE